MDTYSLLRVFADSWALIALMGFFLGACGLALSRSRALHEDAATAIFRHDTPAEGPARPDAADPKG